MNQEVYIFNSDLKYPPIIANGETVNNSDYNEQVLYPSMPAASRYVVMERRIIGNTGETILQKTRAYIDPSGNLVSSRKSAPSSLVWRVYGN